jgi:hypothetical protein
LVERKQKEKQNALELVQRVYRLSDLIAPQRRAPHMHMHMHMHWWLAGRICM